MKIYTVEINYITVDSRTIMEETVIVEAPSREDAANAVMSGLSDEGKFVRYLPIVRAVSLKKAREIAEDCRVWATL